MAFIIDELIYESPCFFVHVQTNGFNDFNSNIQYIEDHSTATNLKAGMGLVQDSMIPSSIERSKPLFQHIRDPRTVSVIG